MPSKDPAQRFEDILENIVPIEEFTAGLDLTAFTEDLKTGNAVERCLEWISEAARKLGGAAEELCPAIPWPQLRGIGNFLRHEYDRIDIVRVWLTIEDDLAPLRSAPYAACGPWGRPVEIRAAVANYSRACPGGADVV